ncbi:MAG: O-methyltransferase [Bacteroidia bacterium]
MINRHFCRNFISHYFVATPVDVLHSPFIFGLYNSCIRPKKSNEDFVQIEKIRKKLKADHRVITQQDLGAGKFPLKKNTVSFFAKHHAKPARIAQIIYRLMDHYRCRDIVELGTSLGISACYEASAMKKNFKPQEINFTTIEGAEELEAIASENFRLLQLEEYISQRNGNFDTELPEVLKNYSKVDMAFIDGNHRYEPTLNYFNQFLSKIHNDSMLLFDDIYWSPGMTKAWEEIKLNPQVTVTVDLFFLGLVFFRKEQAKENFRLRVF